MIWGRMRCYNKLVKLYNETDENEINEQTVLMCERQEDVPLTVVLSQFKYLVRHRICDNRYGVLKRYLEDTFGEQIIKDLEAM